MIVRTGTSGFAYREWKGSFYPEELPASAMLGYYAERLAAVEINNTFYRMPSATVLASWAAQVPEGFTFVLKAPRQITHIKRLKEAEQPLAFLLENARTLGPALGPILVQLPPNLKRDDDRLAAFLALLPPDARFAFEFRNATWFDETIYDMLRTHGAALCIAETDEATDPFVATAGWGYLRLRRTSYEEVDLLQWAARLGDTDWGEAFVFFKHEDAGTGPRLAARFAEIVGAKALS